jgi:hypothetical protein
MLSRKRVCYVTCVVSAALLLAVSAAVVGQGPSSNSPGASEPVSGGSDDSAAAALEPSSNAPRSVQSSSGPSLTPTEALEKALADYQEAVEAGMSDEALRVIQPAAQEMMPLPSRRPWRRLRR